MKGKPRSPCLWFYRLYSNHQGELIEMAISAHPANRFGYTLLQREWGIAAPQGVPE